MLEVVGILPVGPILYASLSTNPMMILFGICPRKRLSLFIDMFPAGIVKDRTSTLFKGYLAGVCSRVLAYETP